FFFQAEDGIRDRTVTGVQTCALPISLPTICQNSRCDAKQPGSEGFTLPLEPLNTGKRLMKDFSRQVLRFFAITNAVSDKGIYAFEIALIELSKAERIALRGLNQKPFVGFKLQSPHWRLPRGLCLHWSNPYKRQKGYG